MIEVASMDTVPAELLSTDEGLQAMADSLTEHIVLAQPCQWLIGGRWQQVQLLWRSESARFFLFAGETAGCPHSITGVALERLGREGLIKPLTDSQLLQRAMDRVAEQLGQPRR
jgi:BarA-like signal transduction histidine kinase